MRARRAFRAGRHLEGPQVARNEDLELLHVLLLGLDHAEHEAVPFPHALCVRRLDVFLHDLLPTTTTQPAAKETLDLLDLSQLHRVLDIVAQARQLLGDLIRTLATKTTPSNGRGTHRRTTLPTQCTNLGAKLLYLRGQLFALLRVLPLGRLFALDHL